MFTRKSRNYEKYKKSILVPCQLAAKKKLFESLAIKNKVPRYDLYFYIEKLMFSFENSGG